MKHIINELWKFAIVGGVSTIINYGVFFLLFSYAHIYYLVASAAGFMTGLLFSYTFNRLFTFRVVNENRIKEFVAYVLVCLISLVISLGVLEMLVRFFHVFPLYANMFAIASSASLNFIGLKLFVFNKSHKVQ